MNVPFRKMIQHMHTHKREKIRLKGTQKRDTNPKEGEGSLKYMYLCIYRSSTHLLKGGMRAHSISGNFLGCHPNPSGDSLL